MRLQGFIIFTIFILAVSLSPPGHSAVDCTSDGNNDADNARVVYPLQGFIDCVGPNDTFDFYVFDTGNGSLLGGSVYLYCAEPGLAARLYQRTMSGDVQIAERGTKEDIHSIVFDSNALSLVPGTYMLRVTYYSAFAGDHTYHVNFGLYTDGYPADYNDTYAQAELVDLSSPVMGTVCSYDPVDWYRFDVTSDYDGYALVLENMVNDARLTVYDGNSSSLVKLFESTAGYGADALYAFEISTTGPGTYYLSVESSAVDPVGQPYAFGLVSYDGYIEAGYSYNPKLINVPGAPSVTGWRAKFPWQQNKAVNLGPWARIGGNPANNGLTAYKGPMNPSLRWDSQLSSKGKIKIDPMKLLDEGSISVEDILSGVIPYFTPSFQRIISEPVIDATSGVMIAAAIEEYIEVLQQETFSGVSMEDGSVLWTLPGIASHGQLTLGPNGVFLLPGGGGAGVTGNTGISCYSAALGDLLWSIDTGKPTLDINIVNRDIFVAGDGDMVRGYSMKDGRVKWSTIGPGKPGPRSLATDDAGNTYGNFEGWLYRYNADGSFAYKRQIAAVDDDIPIFSKTVLGADGRLFISDSRGTIYCCKTSDGSLIWQYPEEKDNTFGLGDLAELLDIEIGDDVEKAQEYLKYIQKPALVVDMAILPNGNVVVAYRKKIFVYDTNGKQIAKRNLHSPIGGGLTTDGAGAIYASLADEEGEYHLEAMDHKLNTIWTVPGTGATSRPAIAPNGILYVVNNENQVVCVG